LIFTQGAALGWYVAALSGLRKTISDFMRSVFYSPAILVTLNTIISKIQNRAIADGINGQILMNQILENFIENKYTLTYR